MSTTSDKVRGYANQAAGAIKQGVGKVMGSKTLRAKGSVQESKGKAQVTVGDVGEKVKGGVTTGADKIRPKR